jgi:hypothetical protein
MASGCRNPPACVLLCSFMHGPVRQPDAIAGFIPQSGTKDTATGKYSNVNVFLCEVIYNYVKKDVISALC